MRLIYALLLSNGGRPSQRRLADDSRHAPDAGALEQEGELGEDRLLRSRRRYPRSGPGHDTGRIPGAYAGKKKSPDLT